MVRTKKTIRSELADAVAEPVPDLDKITALTNELQRVRRMRPTARRVRRTEPPEHTIDPGEDPDHEAPRQPVMVGNDDVSAWPTALRRKVVGGAYGRIIGDWRT
ncbi:hypothetical protein [Streptomyces prunicolor]|uniref:hypothetical protein n=1 Tax=Streptomyces prunicolor TaxID=67348 RepID=UPI0033F1A412